jgi:hypothetical protein
VISLFGSRSRGSGGNLDFSLFGGDGDGGDD